MPATRVNYVVWYEGESQVYGSASLDVALATPPPKGQTIENKKIGFVTHMPDTEQLVIHQLPEDRVLNAEIEEPAPRKKRGK